LNPPSATLGGVELADVANVGWEQVAGTQSPVRNFVVHERQWERLRSQMGRPLTLRIRADNAPDWYWSRLYILREVPTTLPFHRSFAVGDVRWMWSRYLFVGSFNIPRKTGTRRVVGGGPVEIQQPIDTYAYARATLDDATGFRSRWTARRVIERVMAKVSDYAGNSWRIDSLPADSLTVEGVEIADNGDGALARALSLAPGASVSVDRDGAAFVYSGIDRPATESMVKGLPDRTEAGQIERLVSLAAIRPRAVHVHFERDVELRFDSSEESDDANPTIQGGDEEPLLTMDNVLPLPDPYTTIDGERVAQGTWVTFKKIMPVWSAEASQVGGPELTFSNIRKFWFNLDGIFSRFDRLVQSSAEKSWLARISAIKTHYRQTYRIVPEWMRHIRDLKAARVGVLDPVTGTRSPSMAWSEYAIIPSDKAKALAAQFDPDSQFVAANVDGYPGIDAELHEESAAPAVVDVLDRELGILRINYRTDPHGMRSAIVPSRFKEQGTGAQQSITRNLRDQLQRPIAFGCQVKGALPLYLAADHRAAVIVTARPFGPNGRSRCLVYKVEPGDIKGAMAETFDVADGDGPTLMLYCPPTLMSAWYAWTKTTDARDSAYRLFGFKGDAPEDSVPGFVVVNDQDGSESWALVRGVARAMAVSAWAAYIDQIEGQPALHLTNAARMLGSVESISTGLDPDGRLLTRVQMGPARRPVDPLSLLPMAVRAKILGTIPEAPA